MCILAEFGVPKQLSDYINGPKANASIGYGKKWEDTNKNVSSSAQSVKIYKLVGRLIS